jgi:methylated-DNA-[protein]-cysteine S-methyltransferase
MDTVFTTFASPIGELLAVGRGGALQRLSMPGAAHPPVLPGGRRRDDAAFAELRTQLDEYFAGQRRTFALELAPEGTPFQRRVWDALLEIPYGETESYGELALRIGAPGAARAVGAANGENPIAVIIPCHRVIGASGRLTGYGGGLERKQRLLELEAGVLPLTIG